ncbi:MAG: exosortase E/protease, VPEID-CTERM system [Hyphomicrobium sp.]|uniref:exosortase E/protease, VPEID-CTERM system n=1 Tax=Hyphomicrobium sp. TaxID=82 RepID=UPI003D11510D
MITLLPPDAMTSPARQRQSALRHLSLFGALAAFEIVVATFLFDLPHSNFPLWQDPLFYANSVAKIAVVSFCLLLIALWPRRTEIVETYHATAVPGAAKLSIAANIVLFAGLIFARFVISQMSEQTVPALALYSLLLLATGASLAFVAAPPAFWRRLAQMAPVEIAIAIGGGALALWLEGLAQRGWTPLAAATLTVSYWILALYEPNAMVNAEGHILGVGDFSVWINEACSGYEGVTLVLVFMAVYLWVFRRELKFPNVLMLAPLGMAAIWLLNALRIAVLVSIGAHVSPEIALQGFHSQAGWISFLLVTLGLVAVTRRLSFFAATPAREVRLADARSAGAEPDPTLAYLAPFMALVAATILASVFAPHDQWLYPVKVAAVAAALWWFRDAYVALIAPVSWSSVVIGLVIGALWIATEPGGDKGAVLGDWIVALPAWVAALWLALRAIGSVALVPVAEELAFRGFLARWLVSARFESVGFGEFRLIAFAASSIAFGLMHERWLAGALAGAIYALLMYRTQRLSDPIAAHAASNLAIVAWATAVQQWSLL